MKELLYQNQENSIHSMPEENEVKVQSPIGSQIENTIIRKSPWKKIILVLVLMLICLGVSGVAFAYYNYIQPPLAIRDGIVNFGQVKSYRSSMNFSLDLEDPQILKEVSEVEDGNSLIAQSTILSMIDNLSGEITLHSDDFDNTKHKTQIDVNLAGGTIPGSLAFQILLLGKDYYLNLNQIPAIPFIDLSFVVDKWIKISSEEITGSLEDLPVQFKVPLPTKGLVEDLNIDESKRKEILSLFTTAKPVSFKRLGSGSVNGVDTLNVKLIFDKQGLKEAIPELSRILNIKEKFEISDQEYADLQNSLLENIDSSLMPEMEVWIGKEDKLIRKIFISQPVNYKVKDVGVKLNFIAEIYFDKFNESLNLNAPENASTIEELQKAYMGELMSDFMADDGGEDVFLVGEAAKRVETGSDLTADEIRDQDADEDGITDLLEIYTTKTDPDKADSDGDGFEDLQEIINGYNPNGPGKLDEGTLQTYKDLLKIQ